MSDDEECPMPHVTSTFHTGAAFEAGLVGHRNARGVERQEPSDGTQEEMVIGGRGLGGSAGGSGSGSAGGSGRQTVLLGALGADDGSTVNGRKKAKKSAHESYQFQYKNQTLMVYKGDQAAEDDRWVVITEIKENGSKAYLCVRCGHTFVGNVGRVIQHGLRIKGVGGIKVCGKTPTVEQQDILTRARNAAQPNASAVVKAGGKEKAQPSAAVGFSASAQLVAAVDEALAKFICVKDLSWQPFCRRDPHWVAFIDALKKCPEYKVPFYEVLSEYRPRSEESRPGGLYLARQTVQREERVITNTITGQVPSVAGTLVNDGAKISTRKRGMLNSALVAPAGVRFLQQTDATGKKKDGEFLKADYSSAIQKAGPWEVVQRTRRSGMVEKKLSQVVKFVITDRGGGCVRALALIEEEWVVLADACKGHLADLLIEDIAIPFKPHLKLNHEIIIFITSHDKPHDIFTSYDGTRALSIPAATRFATEVICVRSLTNDKEQVRRLFGDSQFEAWVATQDVALRAKVRKYRLIVAGDEFWHKNEVFIAVEEVVEFSLRVLDSDEPNLKDAAFAYYRMEKEFGDPLLGKLAKITDWGLIDLQLDLGTQHMGSLKSYVCACLNKRKTDWLSVPVLAAAAVNPIYSFCLKSEDMWVVPGGDAAVRVAISKLYWGEDNLQTQAIQGWDRFSGKLGIYSIDSDSFNQLQRLATNAIAFFRHAHGISTLQEDKAFAQMGLWLVTGFGNQSAAERTNKYVAEIHTKKNTALKLPKGEAMVSVKMHEMYKGAQQRASKQEQRKSEVSVAEDLKLIYEKARGVAAERRAAEQRLSQLLRDEREAYEEAEHGEGGALVTAADAIEVLGGGEAALRIPAGMKVRHAPTTDELDSRLEASDSLVNATIVMKFEHYGWCLGKIIEKVTDRRRRLQSRQVNFIAKFDMDEAPTDLSLEIDDFDTAASADYGSWLLLEPEGAPVPE